MTELERVWLLIGDDQNEWFETEEEADEAADDSNLDVEEGCELAVVAEYVPAARLAKVEAELWHHRALEKELRRRLTDRVEKLRYTQQPTDERESLAMLYYERRLCNILLGFLGSNQEPT